MLKKKRPLGLTILLVTLFSGFIFRHALLRCGVNVALGHYFPDRVIHYEQVTWENRSLVLKNVQIEDQGATAHIEQVAIQGFSRPHIALLHPVIELGTSKGDSSVGSSFTWLNCHLAIPQGKLLCNGEELYFRLQSDEIKGSFVLSYDPTFEAEGLLTLDFHQEEDKMGVEFYLHQTECAHLIQLASRFYPHLREGWEHLEGSVKGRGRVDCNIPFSFESLEMEVEMDELVLVNPELHLDANAHHFQVALRYPVSQSQEGPFWQRAIASLAVIEGNVHIQEWGLFAKSAQMTLDPQEDPSLHIVGTLFKGEMEYPVEVVGKGSVQEDRSFWMEVNGHFHENEEIFLSLCSQEKDAYIIQCRGEEIPYAFIQPWGAFECYEGIFSGECIGFIHNNQLTEIHIEKGKCRDVACEYGRAKSVCGDVMWEKKEGEWTCTSLDVQVEEGHFQDWEGKMHLVMKGEHIESSWFEGMAYHHPAKIQFQGTFLDLQGSAQLTYPVPEISYIRYGQEASVTAEFKLTPHTWHVWGNVDQFLSFGMTTTPWQIEGIEGWFKWNELPPQIVPITGELKGEGYFNDESVQISLNGTALHYQNNGFDITADSLEGGVLYFDRHLGQWRGTLPFSGGKAEKDHYIFKKGKGILQFDHEQVQLEVLKGEVENVHNLSCHLLYRLSDGYTLLYKGKGEIGTTSHLYPLLVDKVEWVNQQVILDFSLFDVDREVVRVTGQGNLSDGTFIAGSETHLFGIKPYSLILSFQNGWRIEKLSVGEMEFQGTLLPHTQGIELPYFKLEHPMARGEGKMEVAFDPFAITGWVAVRGKSPVGEFQTQEPVPFNYVPESGITLSQAKLTIPAYQGEIALREVVYTPESQTGKVAACDFSFLSPSLAPLPFKGEASLVFGPKDFAAEGTLSPFKYHFGGREWDVNQLQFSLDRTFLNLKGMTQYLQTPLFLSAGVDFTLPHLATIKVQDSLENEGVAIRLNRGVCESIRGHGNGLAIDFTKKNNGLTGSAALDFSQLRWAFPSVQLGDGFVISGDLVLTPDFSFKGQVVGKECGVMGYRIADLVTRVEYVKDRIKISDLHLGDGAGEFSIKQMKCISEGSTWLFEAPLVQVRDFIPSRLRSMQGEEGIIKPFAISHFSLMDIQGELADPSSWVGRGTLNFTNKKKGGSFFDIPQGMLKELGLDPSLLSPIGGEVECHLKGGKLRLTQLKGSHSEGGHSRFYLSPENLSYLSLKGDLHIDLKLEQNVVLKLIEPLTLKVRGTVAKPKIQFAL